MVVRGNLASCSKSAHHMRSRIGEHLTASDHNVPYHVTLCMVVSPPVTSPYRAPGRGKVGAERRHWKGCAINNRCGWVHVIAPRDYIKRRGGQRTIARGEAESEAVRQIENGGFN